MTPSGRVELAVTGLGMVCSLGLSYVHACAAARAGILRLTEIKTLNVALSPGFGRETLDGMPTLAGHSVPDVGYGYNGKAKIQALGAAALSDLLRDRPLTTDEQKRTGIYLNLSDRYLEEVAATRDETYDIYHEQRPAVAWRQETSEVLGKIVKRCHLVLPAEYQRTIHAGHAGFIELLQHAGEDLRQGRVDRCIVGGVDSCLEAEFLMMADELGLLKTEENPTGFLPGEAAAFCLLERLDSTARLDPHNRGRVESGKVMPRVRAQVTAFCQTLDSGDLFTETPPQGRAMEQAVREVLVTASQPPRVDWVLADLNGLERRALDWGNTAVRLRAELAGGEAAVWIPAISFGEVGAAHGPISLCLVTRAMERGYAPSREALILLASNDCRRGAVLVNAPPNGRRNND